MTVHPTEIAHWCWLTKPYWGQELLGSVHTPWVIHQLPLPLLINPVLIPSSPVKASDSIKPFVSNPFHCFFLPLTFAWNSPLPYIACRGSVHYSILFNLFQVIHMILLILFKFTRAQLPNVVLPTGILAVSETFVMIQSVPALGFYSQDRQYFAQYFHNTLSDAAFYLKKDRIHIFILTHNFFFPWLRVKDSPSDIWWTINYKKSSPGFHFKPKLKRWSG